MADYAMVVGIECYPPVAKRLQGPSLDALRFALWLSQVAKVPPANIFLVQNMNKSEWKGGDLEAYNRTLRQVEAAGIPIRSDPSRLTIMELWRTELLSGPLEKGTLWLYWSGHGVTFPNNREAVLCADVEEGDPSYVFLAEFRDALRSETYRRFTKQRLIVDACAEYLTPEDLNIAGFRSPRTWTITEAPEQIELNAVAVGSTAVAEQGGSLFSRVLFRQLENMGWPEDPPTFYKALQDGIRAETADASKLPRLRILAPRFEAGIDHGAHAAESTHLLETLGKCSIPFDRYQPFYLRTMGGLTSERSVLSASSLTAMIRELLQLNREPEFGNHSMALVEFLERVNREFKDAAEPIEDWLGKIPVGARATVKKKLEGEASDLVLTMWLKESTSSPDAYPVSIHALLADASFSNEILTWDEPDLASAELLEAQARLILTASDAQARRQKNVRLRVQVFANPPLMGVPIHAYLVDPGDRDDPSEFGRFHSFVLRSRARLLGAPKYEIDTWKQKAQILRQRPCGQIKFQPAPVWSDDRRIELNDRLAEVDGLLVIRDPLAPPSSATEGLYKLLTAAMKRGVPLAIWPVVVAGGKDDPAPDLDRDLRDLFKDGDFLAQTPERFLIARKSKPWARHTALFWDDDDTEKLLNLAGEPTQL